MTETLSTREHLFVAATMGGADAVAAAVAAGWKVGYAKKSAHKILKRPAVQAALAEAQEKLRKDSEWTAERMLRKYEHAYSVGEKTGQSMTMVRALDSIGKLTGLIQDKLKLEVTPDLSLVEAIAAGKARMLALQEMRPQQIIDTTAEDVTPASEIPTSE